jgi:hypothetical protein
MAQLIEFTPNVFDFFGTRQFTYPVLDKKVFNGLHMTDKATKIIDEFKSLCMSILEGHRSVNVAKLRYCLMNLLMNDPNQVNVILVNIYQTITKNMYDEINNAVMNNTMTVKLFVDKYQLLYNTTKSLRKLLNDFDKNVIVNKDKKYSHIDLIRSYAIYRNVIAQQYNRKYLYKYFPYNGKYLYEILCDVKMAKSTQDIIHIYKIYKYYEKISHSVDENANLFDKSINQKFNIATSNDNNELTTNLLFSEIDNFIIELSKEIGYNDSDDIKTKCLKIQDTVTMLEKLMDKHKFIMNYYVNLSKRLLSGKTNCYVEKNVLRFVPYKIDPELYQKMRFQINDIIDSNRIEKMAKQVIIKDTGKYDLTTFKKDNCTFKVIREYAWNITNNEDYKPSIELIPYLDFFGKCYTKCYPEREITYDHSRSTGVISLSLNNKEYLLHMTFPQIYVLMELNRNKLMSAYQLSIATGIPLQTLAHILNSFMFIKLILRSNGSPNDPNITFTINTNWSSPNDKISLISKINSTQQQNSDSNNTTNNTMLYVSIINHIRTQSLNKIDLTKDDLYLKFNSYSQNEINSILDKIVSTNHVIYSDNKYKYVALNKIDDESDDDFDDSDNNVESEDDDLTEVKTVTHTTC